MSAMQRERRKVDGPSIIVDTDSIIFKGECHKNRQAAIR
jgi:hypothetical protein